MTYFEYNPFIVYNSPDERLEQWKSVRKQISEIDDRQAMELVAEYWGYVPLSNFSYNPEIAEDWPTPWEMVYRGDWCKHLVAVGMEATLRLAGWDASRLQIVAFRDYDISDELTVLKIDDKWALNYNIGKVINWPDTEQIITNIWQYKGRGYVSLADK